MVDFGSNPFDALLGNGQAAKKPEKGLPWHAKSIDGKMYVPLSQVVELLAQNDVLPAVRKGLEKYLEDK